MRNRSFVAFCLSLLIHCAIFAFIFLRFPSENIYRPNRMGSEDGERVSLKHFRFQQGIKGAQGAKENKKKTQESKAQKEQKPQKAAQETKVAKAQENKKETKEIKKDSKKQIVAKTTQAQHSSKQSPQILPKQASIEQKRSLESSLRQSLPSSPSIYDYGESPTQKIRELYGQEFGSLNPNQQKFIKSNLDAIGRITQSYLRYPRIAGKVGQEGDNIVEFYLHPNGDISGLKLLNSSGYTLLDDNSIHTIKVAYKDYPYPTEKTKIRIRVMYRIY